MGRGLGTPYRARAELAGTKNSSMLGCQGLWLLRNSSDSRDHIKRVPNPTSGMGAAPWASTVADTTITDASVYLLAESRMGGSYQPIAYRATCSA
jgi:hypothetical protein